MILHKMYISVITRILEMRVTVMAGKKSKAEQRAIITHLNFVLHSLFSQE